MVKLNYNTCIYCACCFHPHGDDVAESDAVAVTVVEVKMADLSGTQLSEQKGTETEPRIRQRRPWGDMHMTNKVGLTAELPETLGFYDISAVRRERREHPTGNVKAPLLTLITFRKIKLRLLQFIFFVCLFAGFVCQQFSCSYFGNIYITTAVAFLIYISF